MADPGCDERADEGERSVPKNREGHSVAEALREVGASAKDLAKSEIDLARIELGETAAILGRRMAQGAAFGALLSLSVFPFLAFCVIGLGDLIGGLYWLSSLIVAAVCAVIGGAMTYRVYRGMRESDLSLPRTRETLEHEIHVAEEKLREIRNAAQSTAGVTSEPSRIDARPRGVRRSS